MQDRSKLIGRVNVKVCHVKNISKFELKFCSSTILSYPSATINFNQNISYVGLVNCIPIVCIITNPNQIILTIEFYQYY